MHSCFQELSRNRSLTHEIPKSKVEDDMFSDQKSEVEDDMFLSFIFIMLH